MEVDHGLLGAGAEVVGLGLDNVANTVGPDSCCHSPSASASRPRQSRYHAPRAAGSVAQMKAPTDSKHVFHAAILPGRAGPIQQCPALWARRMGQSRRHRVMRQNQP